ncbi:outer dynein arm-docking complex subunit 3-like [Watersipora subatra]|uniref:outer dynein arm-docking complex subunit 3-like n=1 Tax=Watersipora subatra TaxID=2589382 RepID=UPI00355B681B
MATQTLQEKIDELRARINLLEGDRKAYYENSQWTIKQNKDAISTLRKDNKLLRKKLSDCLAADEHVINKAFQNRNVERAAMKNKSGPEAIKVQDQKLSDQIKRLNQLKHATAAKQKKVEGLQTMYNSMVKDASEAVATDAGESEDAKKLRNLENRLDKAELKCNEAEQIKKTYLQIKSKLEEEALGFPNQLNTMEAEIKRLRLELKDLKNMHNDAQISKEAAQSELRKHEEAVYADRKKREIELQEMKKEAEDRKLAHEKIERRIAARAGSILQDDSQPAQTANNAGSEENAAKILTYEEAFQQIKEATGVSDITEVVERFEHQGETTSHLEDLQSAAEKQIERLRVDKEKLQADFEDMKYSGEAKLSSGQRMLEDFQDHLDKETKRRDDLLDKLSRQSHILFDVKSGVGHLADKLSHLKANKGHVPGTQISKSSDEYVLDQLSTSEEKLLKLLEELDGQDLSDILEQMEEEEYHAQMEGKLPEYNTRVKLPQTQRDNVYDDEDESGDDDGELMTRSNLKKQSQSLIDSKNKRRMPKRKGKKK